MSFFFSKENYMNETSFSNMRVFLASFLLDDMISLSVRVQFVSSLFQELEQLSLNMWSSQRIGSNVHRIVWKYCVNFPPVNPPCCKICSQKYSIPVNFPRASFSCYKFSNRKAIYSVADMWAAIHECLIC